MTISLVIELIALRREIDRQEHRAAALLVAVHQRSIPAGDGASSTPAWVQWRTGQRVCDATASLDAGLACAVLPLVDKAWSQGEISASVVVDWATITGATPAAAVPAMVGPMLSKAQLHQLLCDANISRIVTGPDSIPLDVGREARTVNRAQRRALVRRDRACRYPGCDRRPNRCQAQHVWA